MTGQARPRSQPATWSIAAHTRKVSNRLATSLRMAAQSFHRSKSALGDWFRRIRAKLGTKAAVRRMVEVGIGITVVSRPSEVHAMKDGWTDERRSGRESVALRIRIEWCFSGTGGIDDDYMGWDIDDVVVTETTP